MLSHQGNGNIPENRIFNDGVKTHAGIGISDIVRTEISAIYLKLRAKFRCPVLNHLQNRWLLRCRIDALLPAGYHMGLVFGDCLDRTSQLPRMLEENTVDDRIFMHNIIYIVILCAFTALKNIKVRVICPEIGECKVCLNSHGADADVLRNRAADLLNFRPDERHVFYKILIADIGPVDLEPLIKAGEMRACHQADFVFRLQDLRDHIGGGTLALAAGDHGRGRSRFLTDNFPREVGPSLRRIFLIVILVFLRPEIGLINKIFRFFSIHISDR